MPITQPSHPNPGTNPPTQPEPSQPIPDPQPSLNPPNPTPSHGRTAPLKWRIENPSGRNGVTSKETISAPAASTQGPSRGKQNHFGEGGSAPLPRRITGPSRGGAESLRGGGDQRPCRVDSGPLQGGTEVNCEGPPGSGSCYKIKMTSDQNPTIITRSNDKQNY